MLGMADIIRKEYGNRFPLPTREAPKWLIQLFAPALGIPRRFIRDNVGYPLAFDNSRSIRELSVKYRPVQETLLDQTAQLLQDGLC